MSVTLFGSFAPSASAESESSEPEGEFKAIDVENDLNDNAFRFFEGNDGLVLCAGDSEQSNAMTISWGGLGKLWGRKVLTVYVYRTRFTKRFMDSSSYFTVMRFKDRKMADYLGSHSGRDADKAKALGLHVLHTANGAPYYQEAELVIECKVLYSHPFEKESFRETPGKFYSDFPDGVHTEYIGEVQGAWMKL